MINSVSEKMIEDLFNQLMGLVDEAVKEMEGDNREKVLEAFRKENKAVLESNLPEEPPDAPKDSTMSQAIIRKEVKEYVKTNLADENQEVERICDMALDYMTVKISMETWEGLKEIGIQEKLLETYVKVLKTTSKLYIEADCSDKYIKYKSVETLELAG